jgi:glycosyltransferase involved in cell wall biosynthesis
MTLRASVVIPTYRRIDLLERCLGALERQTLAPHFEVIVCDDAADLQVAERMTQLAAECGFRLRYLPITNTQGPAAARNQGWRQADSHLIAFTDDDCEPDPRWLAEGVAALSHADAAAGKVIVPLPESPTDYERDVAGLERGRFVTANCFVHRQALEATGGFDEQFGSAWREDSDLECMLLTLGKRITPVPEAVVLHPVRPERFGISLRQQKKSQYDQLFRRKHPRRASEIMLTYPWWYGVAVAALVVTILAATTGQSALGVSAFLLWLVCTLCFTARRLRGTSKRPRHLLEMLFTSALIPPWSIFYQARGWWRFRGCPPFRPQETSFRGPERPILGVANHP